MLTTVTENTTPTETLDDNARGLPDPGAAPGPDQENNSGPEFTDRPMIPVALLTAHPGNVREDKQADKAFCQSVAAAGIITPLEITTSPDHDGYVVVDGNIRLDAAIKTGLDAVPYVFSPGTADDAGQQYLHMLISSRFRRDLTVHEEAAALFSASEAGMSKAAIRRATGLNSTEVRAGITAGGLSAKTRELTENRSYAWTLEDLALLAPFEDDRDAMNRILQAVEYGQPLAYVVQKADDERQASARRAQLIADLEANGVTVLDHAPDGAISLYQLQPDPAAGDGESPSTGPPDDVPGAGSEKTTSRAKTAMPARRREGAGRTGPGRPRLLSRRRRGPALLAARTQLVLPGPGQARPHPQEPAPPRPGPPRRRGRRRQPARQQLGPGPQPQTRHRGQQGLGRSRQSPATVACRIPGPEAPPAGSSTLVPQFIATQILTMPIPLCQALGGIRNTGIYHGSAAQARDETASAAQPASGCSRSPRSQPPTKTS